MTAESHPPRVGPGAADRERALLDRVSALGAAGGFVPFDRFMEVALYGTGVGFYDRPRTPFGAGGDFYTAAHVSPLFGQTIARRLLAVRAALGRSGPFRVVELGSGDGTLANVLVRALGEAATSDDLEYVLVERSETLRAASFERVQELGGRAGVRVRWSGSVGADGPFDGAVVANEVLDAQPVRRLRWNGERWEELGVRVDGEALVPAVGAASRPVPGSPLPRGVEPGTTFEVSPAAEAIVREVADHLSRGAFLLLDYGMEEPELRAAHPSGTLATVRRHRAGSDPLEHPGASDLSTFVNWTRLRAAARAAGLEELSDRSQAEALGTWGFPALFEDAVRHARSSEEEVRVRLAAKNLLFGFERFRAIEWSAPASAEALRAAT